jgi:hypothetical protein
MTLGDVVGNLVLFNHLHHEKLIKISPCGYIAISRLLDCGAWIYGAVIVKILGQILIERSKYKGGS